MMFSILLGGNIVEDWRKNVNNSRTSIQRFCGLYIRNWHRWVKLQLAHSFYTTIHPFFTQPKSTSLTDAVNRLFHFYTLPTITTTFSSFYIINISKD